MYLIILYDIQSANSQKILKILRRYLHHTHKSVFEGELTSSDYNKMKEEVSKKIDHECDSIIYYQISTQKTLKKEGININEFNNLLI